MEESVEVILANTVEQLHILIIREFRDTNFQPKSLRQMRIMNMGSNRE